MNNQSSYVIFGTYYGISLSWLVKFNWWTSWKNMEFSTYFFFLGCLMSTTACSSARIPSLVSSTENFHCSIVAFRSLNQFLSSVLFSFSIFPIFFSAIAKTSIWRRSNRCCIYRYNLKTIDKLLKNSINMKISGGGGSECEMRLNPYPETQQLNV